MTLFDATAASAPVPIEISDGAERSQIEGDDLVAHLARSDLYLEYKRAFELVTGLKLSLRAPDAPRLSEPGDETPNVFCALMASHSATAAQCRACQSAPHPRAAPRPKTRRCFAGLCESNIPIEVGGKIIARLQVGRIMTTPPSKLRFARLAQRLKRLNLGDDLEPTRAAYFGTRVIERRKYVSMLRLLESFASHLALVSNRLVVAPIRPDSYVIARAKRFVAEHLGEHLDLGRVAKSVNRTRWYFCKHFRRETGLRFMDYLTRVRVEFAKERLHDPHVRVGEAAFAAGFQSLSQFNRSFKRVMGEQPRTWRKRSFFSLSDRTRPASVQRF